MEESVKIANYQDLLMLLHKDEVLHQSDNNEMSVQVPTQSGLLDGVQVIRWQESDGVIQFIQSLMDQVPAEKFAILNDAITRLNHGLAIPGFDLNHLSGIISYRLYLPLFPRGFVYAEEMRAMFRLAVSNAAMFLPTLRRVLTGESAPENIIRDAQHDLANTA